MANVLYDKGRQAFGDGEISWTSDNIKSVLVDADLYTVDLVNDQFLDDIPLGARTSTSLNMTSKTNVAGVMDADDTTFSAVPTSPPQEYIIFYQDTGSTATSLLIGLVDTATGLPVTPNNGDIIVQWDDGVDKIFKL